MPNGASVTLPPPAKLTVAEAAQEIDEADEMDEVGETERSLDPILYLEPDVPSSYTAPVLVKSVEPDLQEIGEDQSLIESTLERDTTAGNSTEGNSTEDSATEDGVDHTRRRRRRRSSTAS
ncbi:MAG: hypothetical protein HC781_00525 [Leptolyngbyaceae cyanobacterium CSU_1_4]|nr:hypothetical protein [Leptolyngbyaceae cyanobacterium CSU_1_4]